MLSLPLELYGQMILSSAQDDKWRIYRSLLSLPVFARSLTYGKILDWMVECGVDVHIGSTNIEDIDDVDYDPDDDEFERHIVWTINNKLHCVIGPAIEYECQDKIWYYLGKHHNKDGPAVVQGNFTVWCKHGEKHRDNDEPAECCKGAYLVWYIDGKLHRDNDRPAFIKSIGNELTAKWYQHDKIQREGNKHATMCTSCMCGCAEELMYNPKYEYIREIGRQLLQERSEIDL